ncbi:hypothetical protein EAF04_001805 [Stromatinia cepivora]|nr:hypothetical protein EAF04_001805 [Stromatinia cepivora]
MVKQAEPQSSPIPSMPTTGSNQFLKSTWFRKFSAVGMIILLYTTATPFSPIAWLISEIEGSLFLDRLLAGTLLFTAMYFQWRIAVQTYPVAIISPTGNRTMISNGNLVKTNGDVIWIYEPSKYWKYAVIEGVGLMVAEWAGVEHIRRGVIIVVLAALWIVGWSVTPESTKREGWEYVKRFWFWIALDEIMRVGRGGGGGMRRRRW